MKISKNFNYIKDNIKINYFVDFTGKEIFYLRNFVLIWNECAFE